MMNAAATLASTNAATDTNTSYSKSAMDRFIVMWTDPIERFDRSKELLSVTAHSSRSLLNGERSTREVMGAPLGGPWLTTRR
jgi:hypothetical protein